MYGWSASITCLLLDTVTPAYLTVVYFKAAAKIMFCVIFSSLYTKKTIYKSGIRQNVLIKLGLMQKPESLPLTFLNFVLATYPAYLLIYFDSIFFQQFPCFSDVTFRTTPLY